MISHINRYRLSKISRLTTIPKSSEDMIFLHEEQTEIVASFCPHYGALRYNLLNISFRVPQNLFHSLLKQVLRNASHSRSIQGFLIPSSPHTHMVQPTLRVTQASG